MDAPVRVLSLGAMASDISVPPAQLMSGKACFKEIKQDDSGPDYIINSGGRNWSYDRDHSVTLKVWYRLVL